MHVLTKKRILYMMAIYVMNMETIGSWIGFDWDQGNATKNWSRHNVSMAECEQVFFNQPLLIYPDSKHSSTESRLYALGYTDNNRLLLIVFTIRHQQYIRVISARPMSRRERKQYQSSYEKT